MYLLHTDENEITHGQRFLLNLLEKRKFASFTEKFGVSFTYLYKVAIGVHKPPCEFIYRVRGTVNPGAWFFFETEPLPAVSYKPAASGTWTWDVSLGMKALREAAKDGISAWCGEQELPYYPVYALYQARNPPSFSKIMLLKQHIDPASWFYYKTKST
jgi:hypothetical protein